MLIRRTLATASIAVLAVLPLTAAHAESYGHHDAKGDVVAVTLDSAGKDPAVRDPDIRRVRVTHGSRRLSVLYFFRRLQDNHDTAHGYVVDIRTSKHQLFAVNLLSGAGMGRGLPSLDTRRGPVTCPGLVRHIDYPHAKVVLRVPRTCLGRPRALRAGVGVVKVSGLSTLDPSSTQAPNFGIYADDALSPQVRNKLTWTPRLHHKR